MISKIFKRSTYLSQLLKHSRLSLPVFYSFTEVAAPAQRTKPKPSPFQNYKEYETKKTYEKTQTETIKKVALDEILGNYTQLVSSMVLSPKLLEKFDVAVFSNIVNNLWTCYIGMKKVVGNIQTTYIPYANSDIFIPNLYLKNPKVINDFEVIVSRIVTIFATHQKEMSNHILMVSQSAKAFSKLEKFHENSNYWESLYAVVNQYLDTINPQTESKTINPMLSFAKSFAIRKYYLKHFAKFPNKKEFDQLQQVEAKIHDIIHKYSPKISLRGLISLLVQYKLTNDPLIEELSKKVSKRLKMPAENQEIAKCYVKLHKLKSDPLIASLAKESKRILHQHAVFNSLSTPEVGMILWTLQYDTDELTGSEFSAFWNNFYHNVKFKNKIDFTLFDISTMIKSMMNCRFNTQARFNFLQEAAEMSIDNFRMEQHHKEEPSHKEEDELEEGEASEEPEAGIVKMTPNLFISTCVHMLFNLSSRQINEINLNLVQKLLDNLMQNQSKVFFPNLTIMFLSCARMKLKLEKAPEIAKDQQKLIKSIEDLGKKLGEFFTDKFYAMKNLDMVRALYSFTALGSLTPEIFQKITKFIISKSGTFNHITYINLLQLISEIAEFPNLYTPEIQAFEEVMANKFLALVADEKKDIYISAVTGIPNMKNLRSFYIIGSSLEGQLAERIKFLSMKDLGHVIMIFTSFKFISLKTLDESINIIKEKAQNAHLKDYSTLVLAFRTAAAGNLEFFKYLEDLILKKLQKMMQGATNDPSQPHETVMIFNELCKLRIFNPELIKEFENFIALNGYNFNITVLFHTINSLLQYKTDNYALLENLIAATDKFLEYDDLEYKQRNLAYSFMHHVFCIKLEYSDKIELKKYPNIMRVFTKLEPQLPSLRKRQITSTFQTALRENLQYAKYDFVEEYPISIYSVDFFIKPNIVIEADGENHFIPKTDIITWPTIKKKRHLEKLGYKVINIPYFEWQKFGDSEQIFKYMKDKIGF